MEMFVTHVENRNLDIGVTEDIDEGGKLYFL